MAMDMPTPARSFRLAPAAHGLVWFWRMAMLLLIAPHIARAQVSHQLLDEARLQQPGSLCGLRLDDAAEDAAGLYDERLLRHIFSNLLSNAVKYSPQGGHVSFRVSADARAGTCCTVRLPVAA